MAHQDNDAHGTHCGRKDYVNARAAWIGARLIPILFGCATASTKDTEGDALASGRPAASADAAYRNGNALFDAGQCATTQAERRVRRRRIPGNAIAAEECASNPSNGTTDTVPQAPRRHPLRSGRWSHPRATDREPWIPLMTPSDAYTPSRRVTHASPFWPCSPRPHAPVRRAPHTTLVHAKRLG